MALFFSWGLAVAVVLGKCRASAGPWVQILFCLQIMMKIKILNSVKN